MELYIINEFIKITFKDKQIRLSNFSNNLNLQINEQLLYFITSCSWPQSKDLIISSLEELNLNESVNATFSKLLKFWVLIVYNSDDSAINYPIWHWIKRWWQDALLLHLSSREVKYINNSTNDLLNIQSNPIKGISCLNLENYQHIKIVDKIDDLVLKRRCNLPFSKKESTINELVTFLKYWNITSFDNLDEKLSTEVNPFNSLSIYILVYDILDLEPWLYYFDSKNNTLLLVKQGIFRSQVSKICIGQQRAWLGKFSIAITVDWATRYTKNHHPRNYTKLIMNISKLSHYHLLTAWWLWYNVFMTPAFEDEFAESFFNFIPMEKSLMYINTFW